ncbi:MAG: hypothetical protein WCA15_10320, partial [Candidatus Acidiferrales bacterium]
DAVRFAGVREKLAQDFFGLRLAIFDCRDRARNRADVSCAHLLGPVFDGDGHGLVKYGLGMVTLVPNITDAGESRRLRKFLSAPIPRMMRALEW